MGTKTLVRLLIALAVVGVLAVILHFTGTGGGVSEVASSTKKTKVFSDFPINDVARIEIRSAEDTLALKKGETTWNVVERDGYPADDESIVTMLRDIWGLKIVQPVTIGRTHYGRVNLVAPDEAESADEAATILSFADAEGNEVAALWLGKVYERSENRPNPMGGGMATSEAGRYVRRGDSKAVFLVGETFREVDTDPSEWIDKDFFKVEKIRSIELDRGEPESDWKLTREEEEGDFALAEAEEGETLDQSKVSSMKSAFSNAQIEDVYTGEAADENEPGEATFRIETFEGFEYAIAVGEKNDLNELPLTVEVSATFEEERVEGEEESDEEKKRLDEDFEANLDRLKEKLEREKQLEGHVFKVRSYVIDSILKDRSELLAEEETEESPEAEPEVAPGVTLPGLPEAPAAKGGDDESPENDAGDPPAADAPTDDTAEEGAQPSEPEPSEANEEEEDSGGDSQN